MKEKPKSKNTTSNWDGYPSPTDTIKSILLVLTIVLVVPPIPFFIILWSAILGALLYAVLIVFALKYIVNKAIMLAKKTSQHKTRDLFGVAMAIIYVGWIAAMIRIAMQF